MKQLYLMIRHNLTTRQALVLHLLSARGLTCGQMSTQSRERPSTMMNAADTLAERNLVRRSKEKNHFFVYRLTESGMNLAKLLIESELPETTTATAPADGPLIPGIFKS